MGFTTQYGDRRGRRYFGSGTPHIASDYAVSAGWGGAGLAATQFSRDTGGRFSITAGAAPAANPTMTLTFKDGTWFNPPLMTYSRGGAGEAPSAGYWALTTVTATQAIWTFVGTPIAGTTYVLDWKAEGT